MTKIIKTKRSVFFATTIFDKLNLFLLHCSLLIKTTHYWGDSIGGSWRCTWQVDMTSPWSGQQQPSSPGTDSEGCAVTWSWNLICLVICFHVNYNVANIQLEKGQWTRGNRKTLVVSLKTLKFRISKKEYMTQRIFEFQNKFMIIIFSINIGSIGKSFDVIWQCFTFFNFLLKSILHPS